MRARAWLWLALVGCTGQKPVPPVDDRQTIKAAVEAPPPRFLPTRAADRAPPAPSPDGMAWVPGGEFSMGELDGESDAQPIHRVTVDSFWPMLVAE